MKNIQDTFVARWYDEVWNKGNEEAINDMFHPEGIAHGLGLGDSRGPEAFKPFFNAFRTNFSDINVTVEDVITEEDLQVARCRVTAKHSSGKNVDFTGMSIARIQDNKLIEGWNNFDFQTMEKQLTSE